jgi:hypothetical protein
VIGHERIAADLARLRAAGRPLKTFGSATHGFALRPPLSLDRVDAFEDAHQVVLPEPYRSFLVRAGNGGAGPGHGVFSLGEMDRNSGEGPWYPELVGDLARPFPFHEAWNDLTGLPYPDGMTEQRYLVELAAFEEHYWRRVDGAFPVAHLGCAIRTWLVVTGPERGHLWLDDRASDNGFTPVACAGRDRVDFGTWYRDWLDEALGALEK